MVDSAAEPDIVVFRRRMLASACGGHFIHDGTHDTIYVLLPLWAEAFGLAYSQIGMLKAAFSGALALFQMLAGVLSERMGSRPLLVAGTATMGLMFGLTAFAFDFWSLLVLIFLAGTASAVQHPLGSSIISAAYSQGARRAALGVYNFSGDLGKMGVVLLMGFLIAYLGWRASSAAYGIAVIAAASILFGMLAWLPKPPKQQTTGLNLGPRAYRNTGWGFTDARGYSILSAIHVLDSACRTGLLTFLPFVLIAKGASASGIGLALGLIFAGGAAGKLICGLIGARIGILRTVILTELATAALIIVVVVSPLPLVFTIIPILGIALNGTSSVLYGTIGEFVRDDRQARAFGLFYTFGSSASTVSPIMFGIMSDFSGAMTALYAISATALFIVPVSLLLRPHLVSEGKQATPLS